ncbi:hypothetical protein L1049_021917 [Liquidambar formosana]|uniref:Uncharacterized protein n=1 Tax=Liquidambar formosana TaxID=63359 RepID=A0AAP0RD78_LIQFO
MGLNMKRKEHNPGAKAEHAKRHTKSGAHATDTHHNRVAQISTRVSPSPHPWFVALLSQALNLRVLDSFGLLLGGGLSVRGLWPSSLKLSVYFLPNKLAGHPQTLNYGIRQCNDLFSTNDMDHHFA